jgi:hypothetical protein
VGKEAQVRAVFAEGEDFGRLQLELPKLTFRGSQRRVYEGQDLADVRAEAGDLVLADGSRFVLGERPAASWADAILNPKSRLDKLGVKPGMRVAVLGIADDVLAGELAGRAVAVVNDLSELDILFYAADSGAELDRLPELIPALAAKGALWIVSRKGKAATIKDIEVMAAAKSHGLVDNKVVGFSDTLTALRFTRRARASGGTGGRG